MPGPREDALVSQPQGTSQDQFQVDFPLNWSGVTPQAQDLNLAQTWVRGIKRDAVEKNLHTFLGVLDIFIRYGRIREFTPLCITTMEIFYGSPCKEEFAQLSHENKQRFEKIMDWLKFYPNYSLGQDEDRPTTSGPGGPDEGPIGAGDEPGARGSKRPGSRVDPHRAKKQREGTSSRFRIPAALL